jgi:hypothetical protein
MPVAEDYIWKLYKMKEVKYTSWPLTPKELQTTRIR